MSYLWQPIEVTEMKQILVLALGSSLLVMLTASSLVAVLRGDGQKAQRAAVPKIDLAIVTKHVADTQADLGTNEPFVKQLPTSDPLDRSGPELFEAPTDRTKKVQAEWKNLQAAIKALANLTQIYARRPVSSEKEDLKKFVDANPLLPGPERDSVNRLAEDRIALLAETTHAADQLIEVRSLFKSGLFEKCLLVIGMMRTEALSEENRREIDRVRERATFKDYWSKLKRPSKNRDHVAALENHRVSSKAPLPVDAEDKAFVLDIDKDIAKLRVDIEMEDLEERSNSPAITLHEMLTECQRLVTKDAGFKPRVQSLLKKWLDRRLLVRVAPRELDKELTETWTKDGIYWRRVFKEKGSGATFRYVFWDSTADFQKVPQPDYKGEKYPDQLRKKPEELLELRVIETFNKARTKLAKKFESEQSWQEFSETCKQLQKDLDEYYKILPDTYVNRSSGKLSFMDEQKFVEEFMEGWTVAKDILR